MTRVMEYEVDGGRSGGHNVRRCRRDDGRNTSPSSFLSSLAVNRASSGQHQQHAITLAVAGCRLRFGFITTHSRWSSSGARQRRHHSSTAIIVIGHRNNSSLLLQNRGGQVHLARRRQGNR